MDRWACLASGMAIQACAGLTYTFAVYSEHLKEVLNFTQEQVDGIGAAKDFGSCFGAIGGILYNLYPPFVTVSIGALLHFSGYITLWMTITRQILPPYWLLCLAIGVGMGGDSWMDTAALFTNLQNFQESPGTVTGVLKAEAGLSGAIFVTIYKAFLKPNVNKFVLLVATTPPVVSLAVVPFIRRFPSDGLDGSQSSVKQRFHFTYGAFLLLVFFLLVTVIVQAVVDDELSSSILVAFAIIMFSLMVFTFLVPVLYRPLSIFEYFLNYQRLPKQETEVAYLSPSKSEENACNCSTVALARIESEDSESALGSNGIVTANLQAVEEIVKVREDANQPLKEDFEKSFEDDALGHLVVEKQEDRIQLSMQEYPNFSLWDAIQGLDFWVLSFLMMTGPGSGLAVINNLSQMGKALDADKVDLYVDLFSIWSCMGRLVAGYGSDVMLRRGIPRPVCLAAAYLSLMAGCLLLATGSIEILYVGSALVGLAYGAFWSLFPCIISEVFGFKQFAAIYKTIVATGPIGAYLLSAKLVGYLYDREVLYYHKKFPDMVWNDDDENTCYGQRCFGFSLLLLALVCLSGATVCLLVLTMRTRRLYQRLQLK